MAKERVAYIEAPEDAPAHEVLSKGRWDYVSQCRDESPLGMLLWAEVRKIFRKAGLSDLQAQVMEGHMMGCSDRQIADEINEACHTEQHDAHSIACARLAATDKILRQPKKGLVTVMIETFGLKRLRRCLPSGRIDGVDLN